VRRRQLKKIINFQRAMTITRSSVFKKKK